MSFFDCVTAQFASFVFILLGVLVFIILLFIPAWYGRYEFQFGFNIRKYLGSINPNVGWCLQEIPSLILPVLGLILNFSHIRSSYVNIVLLSLMIIHYFNRSLIYPFRIKSTHNIPTEIFLMGFCYCLINGYIQATYLTFPCSIYYTKWFWDSRFIIGVLIFFTGLVINITSDNELIELRQSPSVEYSIPMKGLFRYISGANYFGEIIEWIGYAIACWNIGAMSFAFFTICNTAPRALKHHKYYQEKYGDNYPSDRKALIPFIL